MKTFFKNLLNYLLSRSDEVSTISPELDVVVAPAEIMLQLEDTTHGLREVPAVWRLPGPPHQIARTSEGDYLCAPETHPAVLGWRQLRRNEYHLTVILKPTEVNHYRETDDDTKRASC